MAGGRYWRNPGPHDVVPEWRYPVTMTPLPSLGLSILYRLSRRAHLPLIDSGGTLLLHHPLSGWAATRGGHLEKNRSIAFFYGSFDEEWKWQWRGVHSGWARRALSPFVFRLLPRLLNAIQKAALLKADAVVVLGEYTRRDVIRLDDGDTIKPVVVRPGVDLERFSPPKDKSEAKTKLGLDPSCPVLLSVRRLVPRMGLSTLLDALDIIVRKEKKVKLLIVGDGELRPTLLEKAERMGLTESLILPGFVDEEALPAYYRASDVFVLPSEALEGFGLVTLEALASGVPVAGTRVGETPYLLREAHEIGSVVDPGDSNEMARVCLRLITESGDRVSACRAFANRFSWDAMASAISALATGLHI